MRTCRIFWVGSGTGRRDGGTIPPRIPNRRKGGEFPGFLEPPRSAEKALAAVARAIATRVEPRRLRRTSAMPRRLEVSILMMSKSSPPLSAPAFAVAFTGVAARTGLIPNTPRLLGGASRRCRATLRRNAGTDEPPRRDRHSPPGNVTTPKEPSR